MTIAESEIISILGQLQVSPLSADLWQALIEAWKRSSESDQL